MRKTGREERKIEGDGSESKDKDPTRNKIIPPEATVLEEAWQTCLRPPLIKLRVVHSKEIQGILQWQI